MVAQHKISQYHDISSSIQLGDSRGKVLSVLGPIQRSTPSIYQRAPDQFMSADGKRVYVYYIASNRIPDGRSTDDEFTPYVFVEGRLVAIGWQALGGPKSRGSARRGGSGSNDASRMLMQQGRELMRQGQPRTLR